MKLIFAVIRDKDVNEAVNHLIKAHIGVTRLSSTGGFLKDGNTTLMIGTEDTRVEEVMAPNGTGGMPVWNMGYTPLRVPVGGATVFVLDVADFQKL